MIFPSLLIEWHTFSTYYVPLYFCLVFEIWGSSIFMLAPFRRRRLWGLRIFLCAAATLGLAIGLGYFRAAFPSSIVVRMLCSYLLYLSVLGMEFIVFDGPSAELALSWIAIIAIREFADGTDTLTKIALQTPTGILGYNPEWPGYVNGIVFDLIHLAIQIPLGLIFSRYKGSEQGKEVSLRTILISTALMFTAIVTKGMIVSHSIESVPLYAAAVALTTLFSLLTLFLRIDTILGSKKQRELDIANAVLASQQRQFEESKQSIALINAKVHDIKHRIDEFGDRVAADTLEQLKTSVEIYDRPFRTGSQVVDTILYTKSLDCDAKGIRLSAIGDASPIHFIPSSKRFYLFSNILDNAIEATQDIVDPSLRVIGLSLRKQNGMFLIEEYNYFEGERFRDEEGFKTTKKTKTGHGLGLKSIRSIAEEYGGKVEISLKDNMFFLTVSLPLR